MRNPNGYGSVVKLSGNRRKPFVIRKTTGWNDKGHPIYLTVGYTATREEGMILLAEYNKSPWDIDGEKITFQDLYDKWLILKLPKLGKATQKSVKAAYKHCKGLYQMKYKDIKTYHMQDAIDNCGKSYATQAAIKNLFWHLDKFALETDIINKAYSSLTTAESTPETSKEPFTDDEVNALWSIKDEPWVDSVLTFLYTGFRISELLDIETENVNLQEGTIKGGTKTKAGKDRIVPIHSKIFSIIENRAKENNEYLFSLNGAKLSTYQYYALWNDIMTKLSINKKPHECRHTFRSRLDSVGANKVCIDLMMGHKSKDVGERIYTHKTIDELKNAIELITH